MPSICACCAHRPLFRALFGLCLAAQRPNTTQTTRLLCGCDGVGMRCSRFPRHRSHLGNYGMPELIVSATYASRIAARAEPVSSPRKMKLGVRYGLTGPSKAV